MPAPTRLQASLGVAIIGASAFCAGFAHAESYHMPHEPSSIVVMDLPMQQSLSQSSNYTMPGMYHWG